ncbi:MAG: diguanylate cyclase [Rhodoferax sp.]|uniref:diguanylate cyclase domain-containing protein n=1 Tax=Rhodoferax sp. TaxID=50421 RepID=UPI001B40B473|nr:diguanylate cyclase [Rhodoferax sp.]MBP9905761.1 diguanylate cyclase [Rhodoferax sp.]
MHLKRLQDGLLIALLVVAGLLASGGALLAYLGAFNRALSQGEDTLNGLLVAVERTASIGAYADDAILLQEVVDGLSLNPLAGFVEVKRANETPWVVARGNKTDVPLEDGGIWVERKLKSPFDAAETTGLIRIAANMAVLRSAARSDAWVLAWAMLSQALLVALLLYGVATRLVSRPIVELAGSMRAIVPGTGQRLDVPAFHQHDELGALIRSANELLTSQELALQRERDLRAEIAQLGAEYEAIFSASSAGIFVMTPRMQLIHCNARARFLTGWDDYGQGADPNETFVDTTFAQPDAFHEMVSRAAFHGGTESVDLELRGIDGPSKWVHCLVTARAETQDQPGERSGAIEGVIYDITDRKQAELEASHRSLHDPLTGLSNRRGCDVTLAQMLDAARTQASGLCVIHLDLDGFKAINDGYGHAAGDEVLVEVARRIRKLVRRGSDLASRVGGDEFIVALRDADEDSQHLCDTALGLLAHLSEVIQLGGGESVQVGLSMGIACYPRHGETASALIHHADMAMYEVKRSGKNAFAMAYR